MARETEPSPAPLIEILHSLAQMHEIIEMPGDQPPVHNFFNPTGMELRACLDPEHMPGMTKFTSVIVSEAFEDLRGVDPKTVGQYETSWGLDTKGEPQPLETISKVAAQKVSYEKDSEEGKANRRDYLRAMCEAANELFRGDPLIEGQLLVPIERCGGNIARAMGLSGVLMEVKRLRLDGYPDLLGAGTDLDLETAKKFEGKVVRIFEGVVATGSTQAVIIAAIRNWGIKPFSVGCDAVVMCPVGAKFASEFREALLVGGSDCSVYSGGTLDGNWYLVWHPNDTLRDQVSDPDMFVGGPTLGDGGDLTSNL